MAKAIKVERLRDSGLTVTQPNIRPVDTFVNVAAAAPSEVVNTELTNFLSQLSPKLQQYGAQKKRAEEEMQLLALQEMSYITQDGKYKTLEEVRASGEFVPSNPTVAFAYNKGLGAEIGKNINAELRKRYEDGIRSNSIQKLDPVQFQDWIATNTTDIASGYKEYTGEAGVMAGIKTHTSQIESQLTGMQVSEARSHAQEMVTDSFRKQGEAALFGVDLSTPEAVANALNTLADDLHQFDSGFTGTEINKEMVGMVADRIATSQDPVEIGAFIVAARQLKAGSGPLSGTQHWTAKNLDEIIDKAIVRKDSLEQAQYYRDVRQENNENEALRGEIIQHIDNGGSLDDFQPKGQYGKIDTAELSAAYKSVENQLRNDAPMSDEMYVDAWDYFSKLTPIEAEVHLRDIIAGTKTPFGQLSLTQKQSLRSIVSGASQTGVEVFQSPSYKGLIKDVAEKYQVWDAFSKDIKTFVSPEADAFWRQAETELERIWIQINREPRNIQMYVSPEIYNSMVSRSGTGNPNLLSIVRDPYLSRQLNDGILNRLIETKPPSELSNLVNTATNSVTNADGSQTLTTTNSAGEQVNITVTPRGN